MPEHMSTEDLTAALAKIKAGDEVSVLVAYNEHEVTWAGIAHLEHGDLCLGDRVVRWCGGQPSSQVRAVLSHTPATPPEPEGDAIALDDIGDVWRREGDLWRYGSAAAPLSWARVNELFGPLTIYRPADA